MTSWVGEGVESTGGRARSEEGAGDAATAGTRRAPDLCRLEVGDGPDRREGLVYLVSEASQQARVPTVTPSLGLGH